LSFYPLSDLFTLALHRRETSFQARLGFSKAPAYTLLPHSDRYLHPEETAALPELNEERKSDHFLRGRFIAKRALSAYLQEADPTRIRIKYGVFNQPLVVYPTDSPPRISLSHSDEWAACLVFSDEHPMGLDLECIRPANTGAIFSQTTPFEQSFRKKLLEDEATFYTRIWTVKEALSKVFLTGLTANMEVYQIASIRQYEGYTVSTFSNFEQYKALSFQWENYLCSIVLPRETQCLLPTALLETAFI
jgi:4'-phosphopantetheinyl transferase